MKPWSFASRAGLPPAATAFSTIVSTSARLSQLSATSTSMLVRVSTICLLVKVRKNGSASSME
jgi:hypothetical protein